MWEVQGTPIESRRFTPFEPLEVLNYYDGPRIFTCLDSDQGLCLACWNDEDEHTSRFVVIPCTHELVERLKQGTISLRQALDQPRIWIMDVNHSGEVAAVVCVSLASIPADSLPKPGVRLFRVEETDAVRQITREAAAGRREDFEKYLAAVPDVAPAENDRID
jgi:hypothetical protein